MKSQINDPSRKQVSFALSGVDGSIPPRHLKIIRDAGVATVDFCNILDNLGINKPKVVRL